MKTMTHQEEVLVELLHFLSSSISQGGCGLSMHECKKMLNTPIASKEGKTAIECIRLQGRVFVNELKIFINELDGYED